MQEILRSIYARIEAAASKRAKWFWWLCGGLLIVLLGASVLIRRYVALSDLSNVRRQLARKRQELEDAKTAAATARHTDNIARHERNAENLALDVSVLEQQEKVLATRHEAVLRDIDAARDWGDLEKLRQKGNQP